MFWHPSVSPAEKISLLLARRRELIDRYDAHISELGISSIKHYGDDYSSSGHLYMIRLPGFNEEGRNRLSEGWQRREYRLMFILNPCLCLRHIKAWALISAIIPMLIPFIK
jgi:dTDP-4-amino-4,6-dideoxygalactose transaminase